MKVEKIGDDIFRIIVINLSKGIRWISFIIGFLVLIITVWFELIWWVSWIGLVALLNIFSLKSDILGSSWVEGWL